MRPEIVNIVNYLFQTIDQKDQVIQAQNKKIDELAKELAANKVDPTPVKV
jgi:ribosome-binding ATPase YchF (GTP1/OBG family)